MNDFTWSDGSRAPGSHLNAGKLQGTTVRGGTTTATMMGAMKAMDIVTSSVNVEIVAGRDIIRKIVMRLKQW